MNRNIIFIACSVLLLLSCNKKKTITDTKDYNKYLNPALIAEKKEKIDKEVAFWQHELANDTGSNGKMLLLAIQKMKRFKITGDIADLKASDSLMKLSSAKLGDKDANILYSLSQASITQHAFHTASYYNDAAIEAKGNPYAYHLVQFDVALELGRYDQASEELKKIGDKSSFNYLIRKAKWEDHHGKLEDAIGLMEKAYEEVKGKNEDLQYWALSNLADMYGHAGRVEEAYDAYLDVLKEEPTNMYCLKGIAWIAWSHDNKVADAMNILHYILRQTKMPDLKLMLAEIAGAEGNHCANKEHINDFLNEVQRPEYGGMYNKYLIRLYSEDLKDPAKALELAREELKNRLTPETWDWLAWAYYNNGDIAKAFEIASMYVNNISFEPTTIMHTAFIYAANGKKEEARKMFKECLRSSFELGPVATRRIEKALKEI